MLLDLLRLNRAIGEALSGKLSGKVTVVSGKVTVVILVLQDGGSLLFPW